MSNHINWQKVVISRQIHHLVHDCNICEIQLDIIFRKNHQVLAYVGFDDLYEEESESVFENEIWIDKKMSVEDLRRLREMIKQSMPHNDIVRKCKKDIQRIAFLKEIGLQIGNQAFVYKTKEGFTLEACGLQNGVLNMNIYNKFAKNTDIANVFVRDIDYMYRDDYDEEGEYYAVFDIEFKEE